MATHAVHILDTEYVTPDVKRFLVEKPQGYTWTPGQATDVRLDKDGWRDKPRPFTFTSLPSAKQLEFIIKLYNDHDGVTHQLGLAHKGDTLLLDEPFGAISYKGPGFFFAAGAGITPFLAIFRDLHKRKALAGNTLLYSNKTADDVIMEDELAKLLGKRFLRIFTRQRVIGFQERRIDKDTVIRLVQDFDQKFYVCGPDDFVQDINAILLELGATSDSLVFEQ